MSWIPATVLALVTVMSVSAIVHAKKRASIRFETYG
jgi:hypothetical protein